MEMKLKMITLLHSFKIAMITVKGDVKTRDVELDIACF